MCLRKVDGVAEGPTDMFALDAIVEGDEAAFGIECNREDSNTRDEGFDA